MGLKVEVFLSEEVGEKLLDGLLRMLFMCERAITLMISGLRVQSVPRLSTVTCRYRLKLSYLRVASVADEAMRKCKALRVGSPSI